jgi:hypothetical protein
MTMSMDNIEVIVQPPNKPDHRRHVGWITVGHRPDDEDWLRMGIDPAAVVDGKWTKVGGMLKFLAVVADDASGRKRRKMSASEQLQDDLVALAHRAKLEGWNSFVEELKVPSELYPALLTMRPQLLKAIKPRALDEAECAALYQLICGLIETNAALREHAEGVAKLAHDWSAAFVGLERLARKITDFASFRVPTDEDNDDDDEA